MQPMQSIPLIQYHFSELSRGGSCHWMRASAHGVAGFHHNNVFLNTGLPRSLSLLHHTTPVLSPVGCFPVQDGLPSQIL